MNCSIPTPTGRGRAKETQRMFVTNPWVFLQQLRAEAVHGRGCSDCRGSERPTRSVTGGQGGGPGEGVSMLFGAVATWGPEAPRPGHAEKINPAGPGCAWSAQRRSCGRSNSVESGRVPGRRFAAFLDLGLLGRGFCVVTPVSAALSQPFAAGSVCLLFLCQSCLLCPSARCS